MKYSLSRKGLANYSLHLFALIGFAVAQPLYSLLSNYPEFFVARGSSPVDLFVLVSTLSIGIPIFCLALIAGASIFGEKTQHILQSSFVASLVALIVSQLIGGFTWLPGIVLLIVALIFGMLAALAYNKWDVVKTYLAILSPVALLFPALFVFNPQIARVVFSASEVSSPVSNSVDASPAVLASDLPPVIMVVLDEFPLTTLMNEELQIDPVRFPNFSWLTDHAYWFRNATTVSDSTLVSIPTILSGVSPRLHEKRLPTLSDYPQSLFTLLSGSHQLEIEENGTRLSPLLSDEGSATVSERILGLFMDLVIVYGHVSLPVELASGLPAIDQSWNSFRTVRLSSDGYQDFEDFTHMVDRQTNTFREFTASIEGAQVPQLYYLHAMLPHKPWQYLPSGQLYSLNPNKIDGQIRKDSAYGTYPAWDNDQSLIDHAYRRHALQAGYVDSLMGELIERLKETGLYERSLVVITSDHGAAFLANDYSRRVSETNLADIMWIPLFVKLPYQKQGITSDRNVETIDILPTIIDALDMDVDWEMDGQSALDFTLEERPAKRILAGTNQQFELESQSSLRSESLLRKNATIRSGSWGQLYGIQDYAHIVGSPIADFEVVDAGMGVHIEGESFFANVELSSGLVLTDIRGQIANGEQSVYPEHLVIGINGIVRSVIKLDAHFNQTREFASLVSETSFTSGRNQVNAFFLVNVDGKIELQRLQKEGQVQFDLATAEGREFESLISSDGREIPVDGSEVLGYVRSDIGQDGSIVIVSGWSLNSAIPEVADVLVFVNGELHTSVTPDIRRADVEADRPESVGLTPGFSISMPLSDFRVLDDEEVRIFGISGGSASELFYTSNWVFSSPDAL